jgi:NADH:ubiquinone oxidoreductase subunit 6 (subunit J)
MEEEKTPSVILQILRSPSLIGTGLCSAIVAAFSAAGVSSMTLAKAILIVFVWGIGSLEAAFSRWIKRFGRYRPAFILISVFILGAAALGCGMVIANLRFSEDQQTAITAYPFFDPEPDITTTTFQK